MMCDDNHARNKQAMDPETGAAKATGTFMPPPTDGGAILSDVARFDRAFDLVLGHEGGYQNRYSDRGNWTSGKVGVGERKGTKWGISAMAYPDHDISRMDVHEAKAIYLRDYWNPVMPQLPPGVAFECFDAQVNTGRGVKFLQMAVGTRADGIWGPASKRALESTITRLGSQHVIKEQVAHRMYHYMKLDGLDDEYGLGWARRGIDCLLRALEFAGETRQQRGTAGSGHVGPR